jgi:hypothetical protein
MRIQYGGALTLAALLSLGACGSNTEQRAATGGLGGVVVGALVGGPIGAVAGGAAGATAGTLVSAAVEHGAGDQLPGFITGESKETSENQGPTNLTRRAENTGETQTEASNQ